MESFEIRDLSFAYPSEYRPLTDNELKMLGVNEN